MLDRIDPECAFVALENPRWVGGGGEFRGRVYGIDVVQYDDADCEIDRFYFQCPSSPYYPQLSVLQNMVTQINEGRIDRR